MANDFKTPLVTFLLNTKKWWAVQATKMADDFTRLFARYLLNSKGGNIYPTKIATDFGLT